MGQAQAATLLSFGQGEIPPKVEVLRHEPRASYGEQSGSLSQLLLQRGYTQMNSGRSSLLGKSFTDSNNAAFVHSSLGFLFSSCLGSLYAKCLKLQPTKVDFLSNKQGIDKSFWFKPQINNKIIKLDLSNLLSKHRRQGPSHHSFLKHVFGTFWIPENFLVARDTHTKKRAARGPQPCSLLFSTINIYQHIPGHRFPQNILHRASCICVVLIPRATCFYFPL